MTRKLYPYWDEIFKSIEEFAELIDGLDPTNLFAAPIRPLDLSTSFSGTLQVRTEYLEKSIDSLSMEFQMTIRPKVRLSPKSSSILLMVCTERALAYGVDVSLYMAMNFLLEINRRNLHLPDSNVNKLKVAKAVCLAELCLLGMEEDGWVSLTSLSRIHPLVHKTIHDSGWLPSEDTWRSWKEYYRPEKLLELRIVPLEQFQEKESNTTPYSSYTKGYHESGKGYKRDGKVYGQDVGPRAQETEAVPDGYEDFHHPLDEDPVYQKLAKLIQRAKEKRRISK